MKKYWYCILLPVLLTACGRESASIGIIGGADGPTAIMVAKSGLAAEFAIAVAAAAVLVGTILYFRMRKKKK